MHNLYPKAEEQGKALSGITSDELDKDFGMVETEVEVTRPKVDKETGKILLDGADENTNTGGGLHEKTDKVKEKVSVFCRLKAGYNNAHTAALQWEINDIIDYVRDPNGLSAARTAVGGFEAKNSGVAAAASETGGSSSWLSAAAWLPATLTGSSSERARDDDAIHADEAGWAKITASWGKEVAAEMGHVWDGYREKQWGRDEVFPISGGGADALGGISVTLIESLDTLWLLGMKEEFRR